MKFLILMLAIGCSQNKYYRQGFMDGVEAFKPKISDEPAFCKESLYLINPPLKCPKGERIDNIPIYDINEPLEYDVNGVAKGLHPVFN